MKIPSVKSTKADKPFENTNIFLAPRQVFFFKDIDIT